nr:GNAT family N-acetyltransferase [Thermoleptolyngbya sp. M55_K2018_002]
MSSPAAPPPATYFPFADGRWQMRLGLRSLSLDHWIEIDDQYERYLQRKRELLSERHAEVFAALPGSDAAQQDVLNLLADHLPRRFPQWFTQAGDRLINHLTGETWTVGNGGEMAPQSWRECPLDLAGRWVQEDLLVLLPSAEGTYRLVAGSLCFPLYWRLADKLGRPLGQIHAPVPGYDKTLERPMDNFFARLQPDHPGYRFNWSIVDTPELFLGVQRSHPVPTDLTPDNAGDRLWIRVERQTVRRLPQSGGVLFTVRTYTYPLAMLQQYPEAAAGLVRAIAQMPPDMQRYKSLAPIRPAIEGYLQGNLWGWQIRPAQATDIEALFDIRTSVVENHQSREEIAALGITPASVAHMLDTDCCAWVAEMNAEVKPKMNPGSPDPPAHRLAGFAIANATEKTIFGLFVLPAYEGRGIGRSLLQAAEDWLWSAGCEEIWLVTGNDPTLRAYGFYLHLGWTAVGVETAGEFQGEMRFIKRSPKQAG